jgi:hypothetical protein
MKKCLSPDDVMELSETQKNSLCGLWQPSKCDVAVEVVWKDVENDLCDAYVIIVTDVGLRTTHNQHCDVVLKVFYLGKPPQYENLDTETESEENDDDDDSYDDTTETEDADLATDIEEKDQATPNETDHLLCKENCLPLLNIGQMIEIIGKHRSEQHISITPGESICYIDGREFSGEELCDALWEAVKELL